MYAPRLQSTSFICTTPLGVHKLYFLSDFAQNRSRVLSMEECISPIKGAHKLAFLYSDQPLRCPQQFH